MTTDTLIGLGEIAGLVEEAFGEKVKTTTPFIWWDRTLHERDIKLSVPMPKPVGHVGARQSPVWAKSQIVKWYREWKGL